MTGTWTPTPRDAAAMETQQEADAARMGLLDAEEIALARSTYGVSLGRVLAKKGRVTADEGQARCRI